MVKLAEASKLDLYKERPQFFRASRTPELVDLPEANYLVVDGQGEPGGPQFQAQIGAIYTLAYTIKMSKKAAGRDFSVRFSPRRAGDPAAIIAAAQRARQILNWRPAYDDLNTIVGHALAWEERQAAAAQPELQAG